VTGHAGGGHSAATGTFGIFADARGFPRNLRPRAVPVFMETSELLSCILLF